MSLSPSDVRGPSQDSPERKAAECRAEPEGETPANVHRRQRDAAVLDQPNRLVSECRDGCIGTEETGRWLRRSRPRRPRPPPSRTVRWCQGGYRAAQPVESMKWTCPRPVDTPYVGVSPRGGSPNGEAGGGERGTPTAAPVVHAGVQGRGHRLGAPGRTVIASSLPRARAECDGGAALGRAGGRGRGRARRIDD